MYRYPTYSYVVLSGCDLDGFSVIQMPNLYGIRDILRQVHMPIANDKYEGTSQQIISTLGLQKYKLIHQSTDLLDSGRKIWTMMREEGLCSCNCHERFKFSDGNQNV